jgi:hypothetical protein
MTPAIRKSIFVLAENHYLFDGLIIKSELLHPPLRCRGIGVGPDITLEFLDRDRLAKEVVRVIHQPPHVWSLERLSDPHFFLGDFLPQLLLGLLPERTDRAVLLEPPFGFEKEPLPGIVIADVLPSEYT